MQKYNYYSLKTALQAFPVHFLTIIGLEIPHHPSKPLGKLGERSGFVRNDGYLSARMGLWRKS